jgi:hypothetical protein
MGYMPKAEGAYLSWSKQFLTVVNQHKTEWAIPGEKVAEMQTLQTDAETLHEKCQTADRTKTDVTSKDAKIALLKHKEEALVAQLQAADYMTDEFRRQLGITIRDRNPTPHPRPSEEPDTDVRGTKNHFEHLIRALNPEGKMKKPAGVYGVAFAWQVGGEKPATGEDLPKSRFSRKPSLVVEHTEADKGKTAYYATAYENSKGEKGPWSPVEEAVIT